MLKLKSIIFKFFLFFLVLNANQAFAISGKEINSLIQDHLLTKGIKSNPLIRENRIFKDCNHKLKIKIPYTSFKTVTVYCSAPIKWKISVRTNASSNFQPNSIFKKSEDSNTVKLITLRNNLKKGELIYEKDLIFDQVLFDHF